MISAIVCGIAAYHYFRIFESFKAAFVTEARGGRGTYVQAAGDSFNEGYRYVDWLLTVPLLALLSSVLSKRIKVIQKVIVAETTALAGATSG